MIWNEVRKTYPNSWVVFDSLKQHEENNKLIIEELSIINIFDSLDEAYKYYCTLHKEDKTRNLNIGNTKELKLEFEIERIGLAR